MLYTSPWSRFELTTSVVTSTNCMGICKFNHHTITAMMAPLLQIIRYTQKKKWWITLFYRWFLNVIECFTDIWYQILCCRNNLIVSATGFLFIKESNTFLARFTLDGTVIYIFHFRIPYYSCFNILIIVLRQFYILCCSQYRASTWNCEYKNKCNRLIKRWQEAYLR